LQNGRAPPLAPILAERRTNRYTSSAIGHHQGEFMKRSTTRLAALAAAAVVSMGFIFGTALAQQTNEAEIRKAFSTADVNGDGFIDVNEFVAHVIYIFKQVDKDGDKFISVQEWSVHNPGFNSDRFAGVDRNGDAKLSLGEAVGAKMVEFFDIDTNRDGVITIQELLIYERSLPANAK
jgi:Ca2+-binding EF-hand superfamily protein